MIKSDLQDDDDDDEELIIFIQINLLLAITEDMKKSAYVPVTTVKGTFKKRIDVTEARKGQFPLMVVTFPLKT